MHFNDPLDQRQTNACPFNGRVEAVKQAKNLVVITWINPHTIVAYKTNAFVSLASRANLNLRVGLIAHELDGVVQ